MSKIASVLFTLVLTINSAILTSLLTIIGGVVIFVTGQLLLKFFIEPLHELRAHIGRIVHSLIYYGDIISNPGCVRQEAAEAASLALRTLAGDLVAKTYVVPCYMIAHVLRLLPKKKNIFGTHTELIGLSNSLFRKEDADSNNKRVQNIKTYLGFPDKFSR